MASGPPGQVNAVIWRPSFIAQAVRGLRARQATQLSSLSGVGKRGMIRTPAIQAVRSAARCRSRCYLRADVLQQPHEDLAVRRLPQPPTMRPSAQTVGPALPLRSNSAGRCGAEVPVARVSSPSSSGPATGSSAVHGRARSRRLDVVGHDEPGRAVVERDLDRVERREGVARTVRGSSPSTSAGRPSCPGRTRAASARRDSPGGGFRWQPPLAHRRPSDPSAAQRYWLLTHVPRGRPRVIRPSIAEQVQDAGRDADRALVDLSYRDRDLDARGPGRPSVEFGGRAGSEPVDGGDVSRPRPGRATARVGSAIPASTSQPSRRRRSRAAIVGPVAAWTTGARSMRLDEQRSSHPDHADAASGRRTALVPSSGGRSPSTRAQADR